jgi:hypothetical protein
MPQFEMLLTTRRERAYRGVAPAIVMGTLFPAACQSPRRFYLSHPERCDALCCHSPAALVP